MNKLTLHLPIIFFLTLNSCYMDKLTGSPQSGNYELYDSVEIQIENRVEETLKFGDFFSDTTIVWKGNLNPRNGTSFGNFRVSLPVTIDVKDSRDLTLNIEDIFGDNIFTWQNLALPRDEGIGGEFIVDMPVVIRVSNSKKILVDLEDIFSDNFFTWTAGKNLKGRKNFEVGQVGGPVRIAMSVKLEVVDSEDIEIDLEDIVCDNEFSYEGGEQNSATLVGGSFDIEVPLTFQVERSKGVRINLEDTAGDMTLDWIAGSSESIGGPLIFDVPTSFIVEDSDDVNIDFEDQAGDNVLNWVLKRTEALPPELKTSLTASAAATFSVTNGSRGVKINSEDFFSDNLFVWKGPFEQDARSGLDGSVSISAPTTFWVEASQDVNIDAEDVYGDNIFVWSPFSIDQASSLPASVYEVVGEVQRNVDGESIIIEFANLNNGNQYLWGPEPE